MLVDRLSSLLLHAAELSGCVALLVYVGVVFVKRPGKPVQRIAGAVLLLFVSYAAFRVSRDVFVQFPPAPDEGFGDARG